jgi:hypothetical protein
MYLCRVIDGKLFTSGRKQTPGYRLTFKVAEGEHAGQWVWHDIWLTEAAMPMAKRDLGKLGVKDLSQLDSPLPEGIVVKAKVAIQNWDNGAERNQVVRFDVVSIEAPAPDPYAPRDGQDGDGIDRSEVRPGGEGPA